MGTMDILLIAGIWAGAAALLGGQLLAHRQVRAEHWLWKKRRLARARLLTYGGTTVSALSAVVVVMI